MKSLIALCLVASWVGQPGPESDEMPAAAKEAIGQANRGDVEGAIRGLREHLAREPKDVRSRFVLGQILDFDGRPDDSVATWEEGLAGVPEDYPLLMAIGEIRRRQGSDGPTMSYRRGMLGARPSMGVAGIEEYKKAHMEQAASAYERARKLRPDDPGASKALAGAYAALGKHEEAAAVWKSLIEKDPKDAGDRVGLAGAARGLGRKEEAIEALKGALALDPRLVAAHEAMAGLLEEVGRADEAEESRKRAEFYGRLPAFSTLAYSEENSGKLDGLADEGKVRALIADPSDAASELLAILCWSHPHDHLEALAFESLEARGEETTPLLRSLLEAAGSTCTVRSTAHILARRKADGILEFLVERLPGDSRSMGMDMDIAGSLDDLADPRAIAPLGEVLDAPAGPEGEDADPFIMDRMSARGRAALALGAFDTPESRKLLEAGASKPILGAYCLAALHRATKDPKYLVDLERAAEDGPAKYAIAQYLIRKSGTEEGKRLGGRWREEMIEARKKSEAEREAARPDAP